MNYQENEDNNKVGLLIRISIFVRYWLLATMFLFLTFSSYILKPTVFHDNSCFIGNSMEASYKDSCSNYSVFKNSITLGRPLASLIECYAFKYVRSLADLQKVKVAVILLYSCGVAILTLLLIYCGVLPIVAFFFSLSVFMLPGPQFMIYLAWPPQPIATLLAIISYVLYYQSWSTKAHDEKAVLILTERSILAVFLLLLSMFTYPAHAFFFLVISFLFASVNREQIRLHTLILLIKRDVCFFSITSLVYYLFIKLFIPLSNTLDYKMEVSVKNLFRKIIPLYRDLVPAVFSFWNIYLPKEYGHILFGIVVILLVSLFGVSLKNKRFGVCVLIAYAIILFFVIIIPWILTPTNLLLRRFLFAETTLVLLLLFWIFMTLLDLTIKTDTKRNVVSIFFILLIYIYAAITSSATATLNNKNSEMELTFIKDSLTPFVNKPISRIHVVKAIENGKAFNGLNAMCDEFNCNATSFTGDIIFILSAALIDIEKHFNKVEYCPSNKIYSCFGSSPKEAINVTVSEHGEEFCLTKDMVVIDMNLLLNNTNITNVSLVPQPKPCRFEAIWNTKNATDKHSVNRAFDGSTDSDDFWETSIEKSGEINILYAEPKVVDKYFMATGERPDLMPKTWEFMALDQNERWLVLDKRTDIQSWLKNENEAFSFSNDKIYRHYKFKFLKGQDSKMLRIYEIDINDDGQSDTMWQNSNGGDVSGGSFSFRGLSAEWEIKATGDFNGDDKSEVVLQDTNGDVYVWITDGAGYYAQLNLPKEWALKAIGDFNGDGKSDIIWQNSTTGDTAMWLMDGARINTLVVKGLSSGGAAVQWEIKAAGDFNGDGKSDIILQNTNNNDVVIWLMDGARIIRADYAQHGLPKEWVLKAIGDFNGDGKSDIIWQNSTTGDIAMWLMDGARINDTALVVKGLSSDWTVKAVADFNNDGKGDVVLQNANGDLYVWIMNGAKIQRSGLITKGITSNWQIKSVGDFDGDGKNDILLYNSIAKNTAASTSNKPNSAWSSISVAIIAILILVIVIFSNPLKKAW
ncbi:conserved hypothetical protein, membrane [Candidatus Magnetobacterium bavaricum]|uniref:FG-GAP repeat-containing protein n=1 Tax=Candidatus Magnetobacterium bavaricum TaxID=29290 RepID=A0A0F3GM65_9BACT|nr:conserved hypothetical protein, membrane [Candidatus Magnetobacterium bavaricum]